jgi:hypothetical protein
MTSETSATGRLLLRERLCLYLLIGLLAGFGILVELRSAGLSRRMTDLDVYLRAAWAARVGGDMYGIADENDWHYNYPPFYALLLMPLADPPPGAMTPDYMPYEWSVAFFYVLNMVLLLWSAHLLASALETHADDAALPQQPRYCRRWWALRLWPLLFCLPPAAQTAMRGQVNHIVLSLLCLTLTGIMTGRRLRAGLCLGFAICIKVIPVYLLLYIGARRDSRTLLGCALALLLGLVLIPIALMGPARTEAQYERYIQVFFGPLIGVIEDNSRKDELLGVNATDSVGLRNALFNWAYFDRTNRPGDFPAWVCWGHRVIGGTMTLLVLLPGLLGRGRGPWFEAQQFSAMILLMAVLSPICHLHYLIFCLPLIICLLAQQWQYRADLRVSVPLFLMLMTFTLANIIPSLPGLDRLKDLCVNMFGALPVWLAGVAALWRRPTSAVVPQTVMRQAA